MNEWRKKEGQEEEREGKRKGERGGGRGRAARCLSGDYSEVRHILALMESSGVISSRVDVAQEVSLDLTILSRPLQVGTYDC